jgi:hypothetical protein
VALADTPPPHAAGVMSAHHAPPQARTPGRVAELVIIGSLHFWPRAFLLGFMIFSWQLLIDAFSTWVVWFGGFIVLPWTTITYAIVWGVYSDRVYGVEWAIVGLAFLLDLYTWWATLRKG